MDKGLENIIQHIVDNAKLEIMKEKNLLSEKNQELQNNLKFEKNNIEEKIKKEYEDNLLNMKNKVISKLEIISKNNILEKKQEIIEQIFEIVKDNLENMDEGKYLEYLSLKLENLDLKDSILYIPEKFSYLVEELSNKYNIVVKSISMNMGFIIEKDNIFENFELVKILDYIKDEIEILISSEIF